MADVVRRLDALERRADSAESLMSDLMVHMSRINVHLTDHKQRAEQQGLALDRIEESVKKTLELLQPAVKL